MRIPERREVMSDKPNFDEWAREWLRKTQPSSPFRGPCVIERYLQSLATKAEALYAAGCEDERERIRRGLSVAWLRYRQLFGEVPHGTPSQLAALLDLVPETKP